MRSFGQEKQKTGRRSPNQALIRSEKAENREKESESGAHSDKESRKPGEGVRIKGSFGQGKQKSGRSSPNQALIRTGEAETGGKQSEPCAHSDRRIRIRKQQVRNWPPQRKATSSLISKKNPIKNRKARGVYENRKTRKESGNRK
ncbi:hypothetical protein [Cytobacillus sp.]|uniref:hypothetical protein n=1 Tax=Cytobacillus sp. TaxID=2675269 RepID=UPI00351459AC